MQAESSQHKDFGQPVVSERPSSLDDGYRTEGLLTPAQAATRFQIPEYLLRKACAEGRLEHLRVVNAIWLSPSGVAAFAHWRRAQQGGTPKHQSSASSLARTTPLRTGDLRLGNEAAGHSRKSLERRP